MPEEKKNETIETLTKSYEEKIADIVRKDTENLNKVKSDYEKQISDLKEKHNKEISDIVLGRKSVEETEKLNNSNKDNENDKSFFDRTVEETKKKLGITKGEK